MNDREDLESAIDLLGGEPLEGSGFEDEPPEPDFADPDFNDTED